MRSTRIISVLAASSALALGLAACGSGSSSDSAASGSGSGSSDGVVTITVGASPSPHAKILQFVNENLAAKDNIKIDIKEFSDYIQPNVALNDGSLDANFFQTVPYLEEQSAQEGYKFTPGAGVHLEPLAIYSSKVKDLASFPEGGKIGIISDVTNQARALALLADNGFVKLPASGDVNVNTVEKLKKFDFVEVEGAQLVRSLADVDIAVINGNFAQEGGLSQAKDALAIESVENNPAVNVLVWKSDISGEKLEAVKKLEAELHSPEVKKYIEETWADKSVIPAF